MEIPIDEAKRNAAIAWRQLIQKSKKIKNISENRLISILKNS